MRLAEKGAGIVTISRESYEEEETNLVPVLPNIEGPKGTVYFNYPHELKKVRTIQLLYEFLKKAMEKKQRLKIA